MAAKQRCGNIWLPVFRIAFKGAYNIAHVGGSGDDSFSGAYPGDKMETQIDRQWRG